ncbi:MFS transporter [Nocardia asteroides]|uniref:MFS transporter n=1 Tax=Nocardia asteroides TaxID=1824 RepID=UPI001E2AAA10|nr:MFS transporter [Nocardia asteroides]UGT59368.1 MFS transporter [Nocardia asteroides]
MLGRAERGRTEAGLALRAVLYVGTREFVPYYALYAVFFADHGLSTAQISSLLALWSGTAFLLEVPSGAWADAYSRRALLILSGLLLVTGFGVWTVWPGYLGFAVGFVVWGAAGALSSGTFEALLYDELTALGAAGRYPVVLGRTRAAGEFAVVLAILAAAPLYAWGGYALVGWVSAGLAAVHTLAACALPAAPRVVGVGAVPEDGDEIEPVGPGVPATDTPGADREPLGTRGAAAESALGTDGTPESTGLRRWLAMLRSGLGEALRHRKVRRGVLLGAALYGITSYDEYFGLLAEAGGAATAVVPLLVGVTVVGSLLGALAAGRTENLSGRVLGALVGAGALLLAAGSVLAGSVGGGAAVLGGFLAIAVGYGVGVNAEVVADARLQEAIDGPARATVTSVSGLLSEVVALAVFGFVALATAVLSLAATMALLGLAVLAIAAVTPRWLPPRR